MSCAACGGPREVGALCKKCAMSVPVCEGLLPEHVVSRATHDGAAGWLFDGFGAAHPLSGSRTMVGRQPSVDLVVLNGSVSREHAELLRSADGWQVRDLGSRNGTHIDGRKVQGRTPIGDGAVLRFGDVSFLFTGHPLSIPIASLPSVPTEYGAAGGAQRFTMRGPAVDLCLITSAPASAVEPSGGALLHRPTGSGDTGWNEMSLPPLEFELLRTLCARALEEAASPARARGCVPTRQLAKDLPFQSRFANEENVRQLVRRMRGSLKEIGAEGLVEALPGRGYYIAWPVATS